MTPDSNRILRFVFVDQPLPAAGRRKLELGMEFSSLQAVVRCYTRFFSFLQLARCWVRGTGPSTPADGKRERRGRSRSWIGVALLAEKQSFGIAVSSRRDLQGLRPPPWRRFAKEAWGCWGSLGL